MDVTGMVTAGAAGLAAVLAGINLWVSGRRERNKWTRDTLVEVFVTFMDASFKQDGVCTRVTSPDWMTDADRQYLRVAAVAAHDTETDTLTRLRLVAPSRVVAAAEALHEAEHGLVDMSFTDPLPPIEALDSVRESVRSARARLLEEARLALRLRDTAAISHSHRGTGWYEFRSIARSYSEQGAALKAGIAPPERPESR